MYVIIKLKNFFCQKLKRKKNHTIFHSSSFYDFWWNAARLFRSRINLKLVWTVGKQVSDGDVKQVRIVDAVYFPQTLDHWFVTTIVQQVVSDDPASRIICC